MWVTNDLIWEISAITKALTVGNKFCKQRPLTTKPGRSVSAESSLAVRGVGVGGGGGRRGLDQGAQVTGR